MGNVVDSSTTDPTTQKDNDDVVAAAVTASECTTANLQEPQQPQQNNTEGFLLSSSSSPSQMVATGGDAATTTMSAGPEQMNDPIGIDQNDVEGTTTTLKNGGGGDEDDAIEVNGKSDKNSKEETNVKEEDKEDEEKIKVIPTPTKLQWWFGWFLSDILTYVVILNLGAELFEVLYVELFSTTLWAALILKIVLDFLQWVAFKCKNSILRCTGRTSVSLIGVWIVMFLSKFLLLWINDNIFGDKLDLGGYLSIMVISGTMVFFQQFIRYFYVAIGTDRGFYFGALPPAIEFLAHCTAPIPGVVINTNMTKDD